MNDTNLHILDNLWLGTVQLGQAYGFSRNGMSEADAFQILDTAWELGCRRLDTAHHYGESEARIGRWIRRSGHKPIIATKVPSLQNLDDASAINALKISIESIRRTLGVEHIDHLYVHNIADLQRPALVNVLHSSRASNQFGTIGVSCYSPQEAELARKIVTNCSPIQGPVNLVDHRFIETGIAKKIINDGDLFVARSLYLQGVLLREPKDLHPRFKPLFPFIVALHKMGQDLNVGATTLCINFVLQHLPGTQFAVGVDRADELYAFTKTTTAEIITESLKELNRIYASLIVPDEVIDPRQWQE